MSDSGEIKGSPRVAIVTGASSGIGRAISMRLGRSGYKVYACSRHPEPDNSAEANILGWRLDVRDEDSVRATVREAKANHGRVDALVNCAGIGMVGPLEASRREDIQDIFDINVFGAIRLCQEVLPIMRSQGHGGIVNIGSIAGRVSVPYQGLYSATKSALEGLTDALGMEVERFGIKVAMILPGDIRTKLNDRKREIWGAESDYPPSLRERVWKMIRRDEAAGKEPELVADLVWRILEGRGNRPDYLIGPWLQVFTSLARPMMPANLFRRIVMRHFGAG